MSNTFVFQTVKFIKLHEDFLFVFNNTKVIVEI